MISITIRVIRAQAVGVRGVHEPDVGRGPISLFLSLSLSLYIYIYIYIERERCIYIYIYTYLDKYIYMPTVAAEHGQHVVGRACTMT